MRSISLHLISMCGLFIYPVPGDVVYLLTIYKCIFALHVDYANEPVWKFVMTIKIGGKKPSFWGH